MDLGADLPDPLTARSLRAGEVKARPSLGAILFRIDSFRAERA
jgi:hypothetical protein